MPFDIAALATPPATLATPPATAPTAGRISSSLPSFNAPIATLAIFIKPVRVLSIFSILALLSSFTLAYTCVIADAVNMSTFEEPSSNLIDCACLSSTMLCSWSSTDAFASYSPSISPK